MVIVKYLKSGNNLMVLGTLFLSFSSLVSVGCISDEIQKITLGGDINNATLVEGNVVHLQCFEPNFTKGEIHDNYTYFWFKNKKPLRNVGVNDKGNVHVNKSWLKFEPIEHKDEGKYTCYAGILASHTPLHYTRVTDTSITIAVTKKISNRSHDRKKLEEDDERTGPHILEGFAENITVAEGGVATFFCPVANNSAFHRQWIKPNLSINDTDIRLNERCDSNNILALMSQWKGLQESVNATNAEIYTIKNVTHKDEGWYSCVALNSVGVTCDSAYLKVVDERLPMKPYIKESFPKNLSVAVGGVANFSCPLANGSAAYVQWIKLNLSIDDTEINVYEKCDYSTADNVSQWIELQESVNATNAENYTIEHVTHKDEGWYSCVASNSLGTTCESAYLKVLVDERLPIKPYIKEGFPKNISVAIGGVANFSCPLANGSAAHMQWIKLNLSIDDTEINVYEKCDYSIANNVSQLIEFQESVNATNAENYTIEPVTHKDEGWYSCVASNSLGMTCESAYLRVVDERLPIKPYIKEGSPKNKTVAVGGVANFSCPLASGSAAHVQWIKLNLSIDDTEINAYEKCDYSAADNVSQLIEFQVSVNATNAEIYTIEHVTHKDEGWYACVASNSLGTTCESAYLKVVDEIVGSEKFPEKEKSYVVVIAMAIGILLALGLIIIIVVIRRGRTTKYHV